jgi:hypothetical protein
MLNIEPGASRIRFEAATETTAPVGAVSAGIYSFNEGKDVVWVQNHPDSTAILYGVWNDIVGAIESATDSWDFVLAPGDSISSKDVDAALITQTVGVYLSAAPATGYQADYTIRGR